jgi:hypothetical protein
VKERYIALMDNVIRAYSRERIQSYVARVEKEGLQEHGFPRLTATLGILIAHGRQQEWKESFVHMMDLCCEQIPYAVEKAQKAVGNEFSVKEIVLCLIALEEQKTYPPAKLAYWRRLLGEICPLSCYTVIAQNTTDRIGNWSAYGAASEQLRVYAGIGQENEFIDRQIGSQLLSFDENGMYRDPNEPMVYDITTRLQLSTAVYFGYRGKYYEQLDAALKKGGECSLLMQSVTGEIPYGGRSNQFWHNDAVQAAVMEFEAFRYQSMGNEKMAEACKAAAELVLGLLEKNLGRQELYHIKNQYPQDSFYGCEEYAYFDKYMVTCASFLYLAYCFADDGIKSSSCPAQCGSHVFTTTQFFHKTMLKCGTYFAEYDSNADFHYDANGLGRIQRYGAPSAICISVPFAKNPLYRLDQENPIPLCICWGKIMEGKWHFSSEEGSIYQLLESRSEKKECFVKWKSILQSGEEAIETCRVRGDGVQLQYQTTGKFYMTLPALFFDGKQETRIEQQEKQLSIQYEGYVCRYEVSEGRIKDSKIVMANRNGHYKLYLAEGTDALECRITIEKVGT